MPFSASIHNKVFRTLAWSVGGSLCFIMIIKQRRAPLAPSSAPAPDAGASNASASDAMHFQTWLLSAPFSASIHNKVFRTSQATRTAVWLARPSHPGKPAKIALQCSESVQTVS